MPVKSKFANLSSKFGGHVRFLERRPTLSLQKREPEGRGSLGMTERLGQPPETSDEVLVRINPMESYIFKRQAK